MGWEVVGAMLLKAQMSRAYMSYVLFDVLGSSNVGMRRMRMSGEAPVRFVAGIGTCAASSLLILYLTCFSIYTHI